MLAGVGKAVASSDERGGLPVVCRMEAVLCCTVHPLAEGADCHQGLS